ncbi:MAG TPA: tetratricopeptide repeat protein [Casimicrobiaceae bacterium]|jgi:tetratricopeptide (TPR) repeat protein
MNEPSRSPDHDYDRGNAFQAQGRLAEAIACYRRALANKPDFVSRHRGTST